MQLFLLEFTVPSYTALSAATMAPGLGWRLFSLLARTQAAVSESGDAFPATLAALRALRDALKKEFPDRYPGLECPEVQKKCPGAGWGS